MEEQDSIKELINEFFYKAKVMYGDSVESFWFYENEICPCCNKRKIDTMKTVDESLLSVNAYFYRDMNVLIGYLLCSYCIANLVRNGKPQKKLYQRIEETLKAMYLKHIVSTAS